MIARSSLRRVIAPTVVACLLVACARGRPSVTKVQPAAAPRASRHTEPEASSPPRWVYTNAFKPAVFDAAPDSASDPRLAILDGARVTLAGGAVAASVVDEVSWKGFASVPARLGGGFVLWAAQRAGVAREFLGPVTWIDGEACVETHDARPWLSSMVLRTERGLLAVDVGAKPKPVARRFDPGAGIVDVRALDASFAARLDAVGRASVTSDAGRSWTDLFATRGTPVRAIGWLRNGSALALTGGSGRPLLASPSGVTVSPTDSVDVVPEPRSAVDGMFGAAVAGGARVAGERAIAAETNAIETFSLRTGLSLNRVELPYLDGKFQRYAILPTVGESPRIACIAEKGASVLEVEGTNGRVSVEATFPSEDGASAGFVGGPNNRALFLGRCGSDPPSARDLDAPSALAEGGVPDPETPATDDARVCVRAAPSRWIERRLHGPDVQVLARWIPGDGGEVTALVLAPPGSAATVPPPFEGVRVVRLDPEDEVLKDATLVPVPSGRVDVDFWLDPDGAVRGWVRVRGAEPPDSMLDDAAAGIRIDASGHATRFPLPKGTIDVVTGGRFAIARAPDADVGTRWYESTDGGASWRSIEGPPGGEIEGPPDDSGTSGCSSIGCAWGGMTRVGWGGPEGAPVAFRTDGLVDPKSMRAWPVLVCDPSAVRIDRDLEPYSLATELLPRRPLREGIAAPFRPGASPEPFALMGGAASAPHASLAPLLPLSPRAPIDLVVTANALWKKTGHGAAAEPLNGFTPVSAAELPNGSTAFLASDFASVRIARQGAPVIAMRLTRPDGEPQVSFVLGRRLDNRELTLVGYAPRSGEVFTGDLDLQRAEVSVFAPLGGVGSLAPPGACPKATHRFVLPVRLDLEIPGESPLLKGHGEIRALLAVRADRAHLCVDAVEGMVMGSGQEPLLVRAVMNDRVRLGSRPGAGCTLRP